MGTWFEQLGFKANPLDVRPNPILIGLERQEEQLVNHILKGEISFLNGLTGSGKSSLLMRIQGSLKNHKFVYLDAQELPKNFNLEEELKKKRSFFDKIRFRKHPTKTPVLIIDEFQATDKNLILDARAKWENPNEKRIKSIVIAQISKYLTNVTPAFKERLGNRTIVLPTLDDEEMKEILKARLKVRGNVNYYNKLHNEAINLIVAAAVGNPRKLLEYTDYIFDFHYNKFKKNNPMLVNPTYLVTYWGAKEILELKKVNVNAYVYLEKEDELYLVDYTNNYGEAIFSIPPLSLGEIEITVTKHDYIPYFGNATVYNGIILSSGWNFISLPFNQSIEKQNLAIWNNQMLYTWQDAVTNNLVIDYIN